MKMNIYWFFYQQTAKIIFSIEVVIFIVAGFKLYGFSTGQEELNRRSLEALYRLARAVEILESPAKFIGSPVKVKEEIERAAEEIILSRGDLLAECDFGEGPYEIPNEGGGSSIMVNNVVWTVRSATTKYDLFNEDLANGMRTSSGKICPPKVLDEGTIGRSEKVAKVIFSLEGVLIFLGALLFLFKLVEFHFEKRFPPKRFGKERLPLYLR